MDAHSYSSRNCCNCFKSCYRLRQPGTMETWIRRIFALLVFMFIAQLIINVLTFNGGAHVSWTLPLWNMSKPERNESYSKPTGKERTNYEYLVDILKKQITPTLPPCPAMPPGLGNKSGKFRNPIQTVLLSNGALEKKLWWVEPGGAWSPSECTPRHKVAIIIPYHDREEHLNIFLHHIHPFLKRQQLNYRIFIIEQSEPVQFNRGALMNIGFTEALRVTPHWDCFIFHDVDLLPENDENLYSCPVMPRHMSVAVNTLFYRFNVRFLIKEMTSGRSLQYQKKLIQQVTYILQEVIPCCREKRLPYHNIFGGVEAFSTAHFQLINGFSNAYFGWGGEDDDLYNRVVFKHLNLTRYSESIARYTMIPHTKQQPSTHNGILLKQGPERFEVDGLNSLTYIAQVKEERKLYTYIRISLVPLRESVKKMLQTFPDLMDKS